MNLRNLAGIKRRNMLAKTSMVRIVRGARKSAAYWRCTGGPPIGRPIKKSRPTYRIDARNMIARDIVFGLNTYLCNDSRDVADNILTNNERGTAVTSMYDIASRLASCISGTSVATLGFGNNGNQTLVNIAGTLTTLGCDKEIRLAGHQEIGLVASYLYTAGNRKRIENVAGAPATLVWDGSTHLQGRQ